MLADSIERVDEAGEDLRSELIGLINNFEETYAPNAELKRVQ